MNKKDKFPFAMTKKSLVAYIIFIVLMKREDSSNESGKNRKDDFRFI